VQARRARLSVNVESELDRKIHLAATARNLSVHNYVVDVLRKEVAREEPGKEPRDSASWAQLSANVFARDWNSEEDQAYDAFS